jgi:hypothetical protein
MMLNAINREGAMNGTTTAANHYRVTCQNGCAEVWSMNRDGVTVARVLATASDPDSAWDAARAHENGTRHITTISWIKVR